MHEDVGAAAVLRNEAETLLGVEPLHGSLSHLGNYFFLSGQGRAHLAHVRLPSCPGGTALRLGETGKPATSLQRADFFDERGTCNCNREKPSRANARVAVQHDRLFRALAGTPRRATRGASVAPDRGHHVDRAAGRPHVVRAEDRGAQPRGDRGRREAPLEAVVGRQVQALADEILAGQRLQHRKSDRDDVRCVPKYQQRVRRRLAEVKGGVDEDALRRYPRGQRRLGAAPQGRDDVAHHAERVGPVADVHGVGARRQAAGVRHDDAGSQLGRDAHELGVVTRPRVVDKVEAHGAPRPERPPTARCRGSGPGRGMRLARARGTAAPGRSPARPTPARPPGRPGRHRRRRCRPLARPPGRGRASPSRGRRAGSPRRTSRRCG